MQPYARYLPEMFDASGEVILRYFRGEAGVQQKGDASPVTLADQQAEAAIRAVIQREWPDHGIIGEEEANINRAASLQWVIDPIDGTRNFIAGKPLFTTLIALCEDGTPRMGAVDQPFTRERWLAVGGKASYNGRPIRTRACTSLSEAWLATTSPHLFEDAGFKKFEALRKQCPEVQYGGDAYHYTMLAQGQLDLVVEENLQFYDIAPLIPLVEAAGGVMTDWQGKPLTVTDSTLQVIAAGSDTLHAQALNYLQS